MEELNQVQEEVIDSTEDTPIEEESQVVEEATTDNEPFLSIRYNKENVDLTKEEAIELSQKGKNYDNIYNKYTSQNSVLDKLARANHLSVEEYLGQLQDAQNTYALREEVETLREKFPNADDDVLEELAKRNLGDRESQLLKAQEEAKANEEQSHKQELERQLDAFNKEFEGVDASKLDDKVYNLMDSGYTLLEAYMIVERQKQSIKEKALNEQAEKDKINQENKDKSLGEISNREETNDDPFISGWRSVFGN